MFAIRHLLARPASFTFAALGSGLVMASASAPSPFYPQLQAQIGFSPVVLTGIFAIYAVTLLATLLTLGSASDHLGRRPTLSAGFLLLALFALLFAQTETVAGLMAARAVQGIACGLLLSTLSATTVDLEPADKPGLAAICNSTLPLAGLATGALLAGGAIDMSSLALHPFFQGLALVSLLFAALVWACPETSPRHDGIWSSLRPRVRIPFDARPAFWRVAPALFATWATGGFYLSLGVSISIHVFGLTHGLEQGAVVTALAGTGAAACFLARRASAAATLRFGTLALAAGTTLTLIAILSASVWIYLLALPFAGAGFGTCFYGAVRSLAPLAQPHERGELFAAIFTLSYLAFGIPVVIAGALATALGLTATTIGYGLVIICMALAAFFRKRGG
ncbi:MFS transporter [Poseidonocella sp. HB161398]|uniref:MFS transporter n=1 Tax=Poseidonocella sp. HB161398 TaxID=2320855 RepID=UPI001486C955|nr:MFS transporter [Poseidonocella sp. HB161398]